MRFPASPARGPQTSKTGGCRFESCRPCDTKALLMRGFVQLPDLLISRSGRSQERGRLAVARRIRAPLPLMTLRVRAPPAYLVELERDQK
jgi:hypothetical protein